MNLQGRTFRKAMMATLGGVTLISLVACGQAPSFTEKESDSGKKSSDQSVDTSGGHTDDHGVVVGSSGEVGGGVNGTNDDSGTDTVGANEDGNEAILPGGGQNDWMPDWADGDVTDPVNPGADTTAGTNPKSPVDPDQPKIPGANTGDLDALHKCLAKWQDNPFKGTTVTNYRKISASVSIGGIGNLINDNENTAQPFLTLVEAGVNVFGSPTYNLMNRNGYYCIKVNVNVSTNLSINLHCNARLADQKVNVNVGSTQNDTTSAVGVHVLSNVQVNNVRPEGDTCVR